ncbi:hypothetical protein JZ751_029534 [Albula glossodonta]|uniref:Uncharacterized protein n=1 Tax=Albula glossodonta TaxID=121402 RepID=A0A8T2NAB5_9TELE|nr:hypothetical protein JZ751_029534 [Albula glossodonta]
MRFFLYETKHDSNMQLRMAKSVSSVDAYEYSISSSHQRAHPGVLSQFPEDFSDEESIQTLPRFCFPYDIER